MSGPPNARAVLFDGPGLPLRTATFAVPTVEPGEVLVRVRCCTLCGSDLHSFNGDRPVPVPIVLGHEIIGDVIETGGAVSYHDGEPIQCGDRVTWSIAASCGACFACARGMPQKCSSLFKYGHEALADAGPFGGGLAEVCVLRRGTATFLVPEALEDTVAAPASCATATVMATWSRVRVEPGDVALIQGLGLLGLTACAVGAELGVTVVGLDGDPQRREWARRFGAHHVLDPLSAPELTELLKELSDSRGVDVAFDFSGSVDALAQGLELLRIGGDYVLAGTVSPTRPWTLQPELLVRRLLTLHGVHNYAPADLRNALAFLKRSASVHPFHEIVEATYRLNSVAAAFDHARRGAIRVGVIPQK